MEATGHNLIGTNKTLSFAKNHEYDMKSNFQNLNKFINSSVSRCKFQKPLRRRKPKTLFNLRQKSKKITKYCIQS